jgi:hypothetical protein
LHLSGNISSNSFDQGHLGSKSRDVFAARASSDEISFSRQREWGRRLASERNNESVSKEMMLIIFTLLGMVTEPSFRYVAAFYTAITGVFFSAGRISNASLPRRHHPSLHQNIVAK